MGAVPSHCCCDGGPPGINVCPKDVMSTSEFDLERHRASCFVITLERRKGEKLGLDVDLNVVEALPITSVSASGLVRAWNRAHPEARVVVGDWIVEVNGIQGADAMMTSLTADSLLYITVLPECFPKAMDFNPDDPETVVALKSGLIGGFDDEATPDFQDLRPRARGDTVADRTSCYMMLCGNSRNAAYLADFGDAPSRSSRRRTGG